MCMGLLAIDANDAAVHAAEADGDALRPAGVDLQEVAVVNDGLDDLVDVIGLLRILRDDADEVFATAVR